MSNRRLFAIEAGLIAAAGLIILVIILGFPFSSAGSVDGRRKAEPPVEESEASPVELPPLAPGQSRLFAAQPSPSPVKESCGPAVDAQFLEGNQILSYYGNPYSDQMGILGELPPEELIAKLRTHAELYDSLNEVRGVQPALHIVHGRATADEGREGLHLLYVDVETLSAYVELACRNGMLVFLDLQIGLSDVESEVVKVRQFLREPHVHLALDPEFAMAQGEIPGEAIGSIDATDVNNAQRMLHDLIEEDGLTDKLLVVHRFTDGMLTREELIEDYADVRLVIDMDGFGPAEIKRVKYGWYAASAEFSGIKLFFRQDPDLMPEQDILTLDPDLIIYQ